MQADECAPFEEQNLRVQSEVTKAEFRSRDRSVHAGLDPADADHLREPQLPRALRIRGRDRPPVSGELGAAPDGRGRPAVRFARETVGEDRADVLRRIRGPGRGDRRIGIRRNGTRLPEK
jgi:hypothetical protein